MLGYTNLEFTLMMRKGYARQILAVLPVHIFPGAPFRELRPKRDL